MGLAQILIESLGLEMHVRVDRPASPGTKLRMRCIEVSRCSALPVKPGPSGSFVLVSDLPAPNPTGKSSARHIQVGGVLGLVRSEALLFLQSSQDLRRSEALLLRSSHTCTSLEIHGRQKAFSDPTSQLVSHLQGQTSCPTGLSVCAVDCRWALCLVLTYLGAVVAYRVQAMHGIGRL